VETGRSAIPKASAATLAFIPRARLSSRPARRSLGSILRAWKIAVQLVPDVVHVAAMCFGGLSNQLVASRPIGEVWGVRKIVVCELLSLDGVAEAQIASSAGTTRWTPTLPR
jgi:hypothetical protein